jgi:hypothetical protein
MKESYRIPVVLMIVFGLYWMLTSLPSKTPRFRGSGAVGGSSTFKAPSHRPSFDMASTKKHIKRSWGWLDALKEARLTYEYKMEEWQEKWKEIRDIVPFEWRDQAIQDLNNSAVAQERTVDAYWDELHFGEIGYTDEYLKLRDKVVLDELELIRLHGVMQAERTAIENERSQKEKVALDSFKNI